MTNTAEQQFERYLHMLAGDTGTLHFRLLRGPKDAQETREYNITPSNYDSDTIYQRFVEKNGEGWNIFAQVSTVSGRDSKDPVAVRVLWADLDFKAYPAGEEQVKALINTVTRPTMIVRSGHGFHLYWELNEPVSPVVAQAFTRSLIWQLGGDAVQNANRIMRVPGLDNMKDASNPVPVRVLYDSGKTYRLGDLKIDPVLDKLPHGLMKRVVHGPTEPDLDRSAYDFKVAADLLRNGLSANEARHIFNTYRVSGKAATEGLGRARHIERTIANAQKAVGVALASSAVAGNQPDVKLYTIAELLETFQPSFVIEDLLPEPGVMIVAAPSKARKSFFVMQLGLALAEGKPFLGFDIPKSRKTLYVQAELAPFMVGERFKGLLGNRAKPDNLMIANVPAADLTRHPEWLLRLVEENGFEVVIIDPVAKFMSGDENNSISVGEFFNNLGKLREKGVSVILVHHARKLNEGQQTTANSMRGSNRFFADVDAAVLLTPESDKTLVKYELRAAAPKSDHYIFAHPDGHFDLFPYINRHLQEALRAEQQRRLQRPIQGVTPPSDDNLTQNLVSSEPTLDKSDSSDTIDTAILPLSDPHLNLDGTGVEHTDGAVEVLRVGSDQSSAQTQSSAHERAVERGSRTGSVYAPRERQESHLGSSP